MFPSENKTKQTLIIKGKIDKFGYIEARNSLYQTPSRVWKNNRMQQDILNAHTDKCFLLENRKITGK